MRRFTAGGASVVVLILAGVVGLELYVRGLAPRARNRVVKELADRFDADVTLSNLQLTLLPHPGVSGGPLTIRHRGWNDAHPLLSISRFDAQSTFLSLLFQRDRVRFLRIQGLEIHVPHRGKSTVRTVHEGDEELDSDRAGNERDQMRIGFETIIADGTLLEIEPKDLAKGGPLRFDIRKLEMHAVGRAQPMRFDAVLHNPKPPGLITTGGSFGPWQKEDPRATALSGNYNFQNANLAVFSGISGILTSTGNYGGVLGHINVKGHTDVPDFALKRGGMPVHLTTDFQSVVNGMNGDTILESVDAHFLETDLHCKGAVTHKGDLHGKTVDLDAATGKSARIEDVLRLVMGNDKALIKGNLTFQSKIIIPPGKQDVATKLRLKGTFQLSSAVFTNPKVNRQIAILSLRARGISKADEENESLPHVLSDLRANFTLQNGLMTLTPMFFDLPGASVRLNGTFTLPSKKLDLDGLFRMQATLSETQSGIKHWLLKPLDPLFEKNGAGLQLPFKVSGTEEHPTLAVNAFHHTFKLKSAP